MASNSKRQQTIAKRNREAAVREKRARKQEKKYAAAQARAVQAAENLTPPVDTRQDEESGA